MDSHPLSFCFVHDSFVKSNQPISFVQIHIKSLYRHIRGSRILCILSLILPSRITLKVYKIHRLNGFKTGVGGGWDRVAGCGPKPFLHNTNIRHASGVAPEKRQAKLSDRAGKVDRSVRA